MTITLKAYTQGNEEIGVTTVFINGQGTGTGTATLNVSVGSQIKFWNYVFSANGKHLTEVDWSSTGGQLISGDPAKTKYSLSEGKYEFVPQNWANTSFLSPGPADTVYNAWAQGATSAGGWVSYDVEKIAFYVDKTIGAQVWTLVMKFSDGTSSSYSWNLNVYAPVAPLTFNDPSGIDEFQFGPFLVGSAGVSVYVPVPVPWNAPDYLTPAPSSIYKFGCAASPTNAWTFQGTVTNGTPSDGYAYCVQLVKFLLPPEVTFAKTNYNRHIYIPVLGDCYYVNIPVPTDSSGHMQWGVDGSVFNLTDFPWAYYTDAFTRATANSGTMAVPPANSIPDVNRVFNSFYADNPNLLEDMGPGIGDVPIEINANWQFITYLVWHPDGGIPIGMSSQSWFTNCNEYNAAADKNATLQNSQYAPLNWDLTKTSQTLGDYSSVSSYLRWYYNRAEYNRTTPTYKVRPKKAAGGVSNIAPMGSGAMNGMVTVPNFGNKVSLPRGSAVGFSGMNMV